jgi:hypothetical protein
MKYNNSSCIHLPPNLVLLHTEIHTTLHHLHVLLSWTQSAVILQHALKLDRMFQLIGRRLSVKVKKCMLPATDMCNANPNREE